ncbi:MAG: bifunctional [glutamate--ammonia ligase]-adenylyl-L-tyrosine phosphorylase/[glutamate--ammonia-ligase] adenylyltransferase [Myxococcota bacterium]
MSEDWGIGLRRLPPEERAKAVRERLPPSPRLPGATANRVAQVLSPVLGHGSVAPASDRLLQVISESADPARVAYALVDGIRHHPNPGQLLTSASLSVIGTLCGASAWATRLFHRDPQLVLELADRVTAGDLDRGMDFDGPASRIAATAPTTEEFERLLRRFRNRHMLRVALMELTDHDVRETSRELADLASACFSAAISFHQPRLEREAGRDFGPAVVIGMGKLGGRELNFSSDVDVIYAYGEETSPEQHAFFVRLFERVTHSLRAVQETGFVFRVDLDLRPEGTQGPICNGLRGLERYYETWGRPWERAAWLRARPVAGDPMLGRDLMKTMEPFVYRRSLDLSQVEALIRMKQAIDAHRGPRSSLDVKLSRGGIREIEFFVQAHQLLHAGRQPELRSPNTLDALNSLTSGGFVSTRNAEILEQSYRWLRRVEHRLQLADDQQVHEMPRGPEDQARLAHTLDLENGAAVLEKTRGMMTEVHRRFSTLLGTADDREPLPPDLSVLLDPNAPDDARAESAYRLGASRPHAAVAAVNRATRIPGAPLHPTAPDRAADVGQRLVRDCFESPDPDRALARLPDALRVIRRHSGYLGRLEITPVRRGLSRLLGMSDFLSQTLVRHPRLLDMVLAHEQLPERSTLRDLLRGQIEANPDPEDRLDAMVELKQEEVLRCAVADLAGELTVVQVEEHLTSLAEIILEAALESARQDIAQRYGPPPPGASLTLVAGGSMGAGEMSYKTDLDLSALITGSGHTEGGRRDSISTHEFFTRVVQRCIALLATPLAGGVLYQVDTRLRPSGNQGTLVTTLGAFRQYHRERAQLWERQALVRSRPLFATSPDVQDALYEAQHQGGPPDPHAIRRMKERLAREQGVADDDIKLGRGGLVELQFVVQYLQLQARGRSVPSTRGALRRLAGLGRLELQEAEALIEAFDHLRTVQNWRRLSDVDFHRLRVELSLDEARRRIHDTFRRVLGGS